MTMHVQAFHQGIRYRVEELGVGVWRWSFTTPTGNVALRARDRREALGRRRRLPGDRGLAASASRP